MSYKDKIIIIQKQDPMEEIREKDAQCPKCFSYEEPIRQGKVYVCPECGYVGHIEDWY